MAIQFFCTACRKPIEIDDDAANQMVTCPYCQAAVTAPAASDPTVGGQIPRDAPALLPDVPPESPPSNRLGWIALSCAVILVVCLGISVVISLGARKDIPAGASPSETIKIMQSRPQSLGVRIFAIFSNCAVPLVGVVCAIAALVRKGRPLWPTVVALVVIVGYAILACVGTAILISQAASKAAG